MGGNDNKDSIIVKLVIIALLAVLLTWLTMDYQSNKIIVEYMRYVNEQARKAVEESTHTTDVKNGEAGETGETAVAGEPGSDDELIEATNTNENDPAAKEWAEKKYEEYLSDLERYQYIPITVSVANKGNIDGIMGYSDMEQAGYKVESVKKKIPSFIDIYGLEVSMEGVDNRSNEDEYPRAMYVSFTNLTTKPVSIEDCTLSCVDTDMEFKLFIGDNEHIVKTGDRLNTILNTLESANIVVSCNEDVAGTVKGTSNSEHTLVMYDNKEWELNIRTVNKEDNGEIVYKIISLYSKDKELNKLYYTINVVTKEKLQARYIPELKVS